MGFWGFRGLGVGVELSKRVAGFRAESQFRHHKKRS